MRKFFCAMILLLLAGAAWGSPKNVKPAIYARVEISYYGWDVLTRSRLSLDAVRNNAKIKIVISDPYEIEQFVKWAHLKELETMVEQKDKAFEEDPRLVIDLFDRENKRTTTYYASPFKLLSEDSKKSRKIDDEFKNKFHFRNP